LGPSVLRGKKALEGSFPEHQLHYCRGSERGFTRSGAGNRVSSDLLIGLLLYRLSGTESTDDQ
jgi:hypothetical protein